MFTFTKNYGLVKQYQEIYEKSLSNYKLSYELRFERHTSILGVANLSKDGLLAEMSDLTKATNKKILELTADYFFNEEKFISNINLPTLSFDTTLLNTKVNQFNKTFEEKYKEKYNKEFKAFKKHVKKPLYKKYFSFWLFSIPIFSILVLIFNINKILPIFNIFLLIFFIMLYFYRGYIDEKIDRRKRIIKEQLIYQQKQKGLSIFNDQIKPVILNYYENVEKEIIRKIRNDYVDKIHIFQYETKNKIDKINNVPKQISNSLNIFDFDFIRESCKYADTIDAKEEHINEQIKKYLNLRQSYIQKEIYTKLDRETKKLTKEYFTFIQEYLLEMNIEGGISKRIMEEALKETFKTKDINLAVKKDDNIINLDTATNVVIGAGSILTGTLIASNPAGWIFGAAVGGFILAGQADKIKVLLKKIGIGINSKRVEEKIKNIEQAIKDNTIKSLEPACNELKNNLFLINDKIRDNLLSELEDYIKPKLQIED